MAENFENDAGHTYSVNTRRLKANFDAIIAKYDRHFPGDDTIDLDTGQIYVRGSLDKVNARPFGCCRLAETRKRGDQTLYFESSDSGVSLADLSYRHARGNLSHTPLLFSLIEGDDDDVHDISHSEEEPSDAETISSDSDDDIELDAFVDLSEYSESGENSDVEPDIKQEPLDSDYADDDAMTTPTSLKPHSSGTTFASDISDFKVPTHNQFTRRKSTVSTAGNLACSYSPAAESLCNDTYILGDKNPGKLGGSTKQLGFKGAPIPESVLKRLGRNSSGSGSGARPVRKIQPCLVEAYVEQQPLSLGALHPGSGPADEKLHGHCPVGRPEPKTRMKSHSPPMDVLSNPNSAVCAMNDEFEKLYRNCFPLQTMPDKSFTAHGVSQQDSSRTNIHFSTRADRPLMAETSCLSAHSGRHGDHRTPPDGMDNRKNDCASGIQKCKINSAPIPYNNGQFSSVLNMDGKLHIQKSITTTTICSGYRMDSKPAGSYLGVGSPGGQSMDLGSPDVRSQSPHTLTRGGIASPMLSRNKQSSKYAGSTGDLITYLKSDDPMPNFVTPPRFSVIKDGSRATALREIVKATSARAKLIHTPESLKQLPSPKMELHSKATSSKSFQRSPMNELVNNFDLTECETPVRTVSSRAKLFSPSSAEKQQSSQNRCFSSSPKIMSTSKPSLRDFTSPLPPAPTSAEKPQKRMCVAKSKSRDTVHRVHSVRENAGVDDVDPWCQLSRGSSVMKNDVLKHDSDSGNFADSEDELSDVNSAPRKRKKKMPVLTAVRSGSPGKRKFVHASRRLSNEEMNTRFGSSSCTVTCTPTSHAHNMRLGTPEIQTPKSSKSCSNLQKSSDGVNLRDPSLTPASMLQKLRLTTPEYPKQQRQSPSMPVQQQSRGKIRSKVAKNILDYVDPPGRNSSCIRSDTSSSASHKPQSNVASIPKYSDSHLETKSNGRSKLTSTPTKHDVSMMSVDMSVILPVMTTREQHAPVKMHALDERMSRRNCESGDAHGKAGCAADVYSLKPAAPDSRDDPCGTRLGNNDNRLSGRKSVDARMSRVSKWVQSTQKINKLKSGVQPYTTSRHARSRSHNSSTAEMPSFSSVPERAGLGGRLSSHGGPDVYVLESSSEDEEEDKCLTLQDTVDTDQNRLSSDEESTLLCLSPAVKKYPEKQQMSRWSPETLSTSSRREHVDKNISVHRRHDSMSSRKIHKQSEFLGTSCESVSKKRQSQHSRNFDASGFVTASRKQSHSAPRNPSQKASGSSKNSFEDTLNLNTSLCLGPGQCQKPLCFTCAEADSP